MAFSLFGENLFSDFLIGAGSDLSRRDVRDRRLRPIKAVLFAPLAVCKWSDMIPGLSF
jgi:hypothetical protein